jgi:hypothetical protein
LELINLKNVSSLQFEELRKKNTKGRKWEVNGGQERISENSTTLVTIVGDGIRGKNLDPASVIKRLEDYEHMLQDYTLMKTKNKIKDSEVEFEEWREVIK